MARLHRADVPAVRPIPAILGTVVFSVRGMPFLRGGVREIRDRRPGMMLLISLAILVAFVASLASEFGVLDLEFWWELALLIDVMLLGHWQEMRALGQASGALEALAALLPDEAELIHDDMTHTVPVAELRPGDLVLVRPGGGCRRTGRSWTGIAAFDESMITGESSRSATARRSRRGRHGRDRRRGPDPGRRRRRTTRPSRASSASSWSAGVAFEGAGARRPRRRDPLLRRGHRRRAHVRRVERDRRDGRGPLSVPSPCS
jgi:hypothetical protein